MAGLDRKKLLLYFTLFYVIGYYLYLYFMSKTDGISTLGGTIFSVFAPLISSIIIFVVFLKRKGSDPYFWLLLSLGGFSYAAAEGAFLLKEAPFANLPDLFFMLQIACYLAAIIYKIRAKRGNLHVIKFTFDTCIVMSVAIAFSWHFIIHDIITANNGSKLSLFVSIGYPIGDLLLLFGAISFYLGSKEFFPPKVLYFLTGSLLVQVLADSSHLLVNTHTSIVDPLSSLASLLMAIAATNAIENSTTDRYEKKKKESVKDFISLRLLLPFLSVILLFMVILFQNQQFNSLIIGSAVAILLVLFRQIFTALENQSLFAKHHNLTEELEQKIGERTEELSSKNQQLVTAVQKMKHMAFHDVLSGLPNRRLFLARLLTAMEEAKRNKYSIAVIFIDLDRFKNINDTLGHEFGDLLLKYVSKQMSKSLRKTDTVSRQGGDEFTIIMNKIKAENDVIPLIHRLQSLVSKPITIKGEELHVSMSIGVAFYPKDGTSTEELMKHADMAMYYAKEDGRNNYKFFSTRMYQAISRKMTLENGLRKAIANNEFVLFYQPQVNINTGEVVGVEALLRWNSIEAGMVSPTEFIPLAEETRLIIPIGEWVLYTACKQAQVWHNAGNNQLKLAVNLSPLQFLHDNLVEMITNVLEKTGFNPHYLVLEITEGIAFHDAEEAIKKMQILRDLGVRISIDDFGTGYSSLMYLKRFPINTLKIAQSFVQDIATNESDKALVQAIVSLAHSLGLNVIAEGLEAKEQVHILQKLQCDEIQGDIFSKPLTVMQLGSMLRSRFPVKPEAKVLR
jgi:diguanylate cyclase